MMKPEQHEAVEVSIYADDPEFQPWFDDILKEETRKPSSLPATRFGRAHDEPPQTRGETP